MRMSACISLRIGRLEVNDVWSLAARSRSANGNGADVVGVGN